MPRIYAHGPEEFVIGRIRDGPNSSDSSALLCFAGGDRFCNCGIVRFHDIYALFCFAPDENAEYDEPQIVLLLLFWPGRRLA
jgi:hypothetical protein